MSYGLSLVPEHYKLFMRQFAQFHTGWPLCCCLLTTAEPRDKTVLPLPRFASDNEPVMLPSDTCLLFAKRAGPRAGGRELLLSSPALRVHLGASDERQDSREVCWESHWLTERLFEQALTMEGGYAGCQGRDTPFDSWDREMV